MVTKSDLNHYEVFMVFISFSLIIHIFSIEITFDYGGVPSPTGDIT